MLKTYEALYENGQLKFLKDSPHITNAHVIITPVKLRQPTNSIAGKGKTLGDIVNPLLEEGDWE